MTLAKGELKNVDVFYGYITNFRMRFSNLVHLLDLLGYRSKMPTWPGGSWCVKKIAKKIADVLYGWSLTLVDS